MHKEMIKVFYGVKKYGGWIGPRRYLRPSESLCGPYVSTPTLISGLDPGVRPQSWHSNAAWRGMRERSIRCHFCGCVRRPREFGNLAGEDSLIPALQPFAKEVARVGDHQAQFGWRPPGGGASSRTPFVGITSRGPLSLFCGAV
jgi:hypothetical protein